MGANLSSTPPISRADGKRAATLSPIIIPTHVPLCSVYVWDRADPFSYSRGTLPLH